MNDCVKVSIVVPVYNVEAYLDRCIESIVNQTYKNLEIILVDDGSPDNCPQMCDDWAKKDARIKVVHKENAGLGMARNTGIDNASGKYIFFFDSDDYVSTEIVEKCVNDAEANFSDVVIYGRYDAYEDGRIIVREIKVDKRIYDSRLIKDKLLPAMFTYDMGFGVSAWGKMYNLEVMKRLNKRFPSEKEIISEDAYFAIDFFSEISIATIITENLYYYYKRSSSLSRSFSKDRQAKNNDFLLKTLSLINEKRLSENLALHVTARYHMYTLSAMKQVVRSDLSKKLRSNELKKILKSEILYNTLNRDVLILHNKKSKLFFTLLKYKFYLICKILLYLKANYSYGRESFEQTDIYKKEKFI